MGYQLNSDQILRILCLQRHIRVKLTAAFVRCNKEAWQMSPNTSTALFTFPKDRGGLQIKMPRAIICIDLPFGFPINNIISLEP